MVFSVLIVLVGLSSLNAQVFVEDFKLSNSQDVTHLRVEYYKTNGSLDGNSISYSLWKDLHAIHVSQINQQFGQNLRVLRTENGFIFEGSDSSLEFRIEEDTNSFALISVIRSSRIAVRLDDCVKLRSNEISWYGGPEQRYQYWPVDRLSFDDYSYLTKQVDNCAVAERYWLNSQGVFIYVDQEAPLFLNQIPLETMCLTVEKKLPYFTHDNDTISFNYKVGIASDARKAHMMAINRYLKKPSGYPDERMITHPIWSTWARYYEQINENVLLTYADEISQNGFNNSQFEIDDGWEICYGALEFNTTKFPNIKATTDALKSRGYRVALWIHPFINKACEPYYSNALREGYLVLDHNNDASTQWWRSDGYNAAYVDFTKPAAAKWFTDKVRNLATSAGIDSFKFDAGESSFAPIDPVLNATNKYHPLAITTDYINIVSLFGPMEEVRSVFRNQEIPIFLRINDKDSEWTWNNGLPTLVTTLLQLNMVGYPLILPDMIGGNGYGNRKPNKEMFIRWLQATVFMPALQFSFVPWDFDDETISISLGLTNLHAKYAEVIINRFKLATENGDPVNPPIWWIAPEDRVAQYVNDVPLYQTEAVQGAIGRLPCNVTPPVAEDKITLVIWYKEGYSTPIYSFDARESNLEKGSHWVDDKTLGGRAYFQAAADPATLTIESMKSVDSGLYRCRVDFLKSPTRNSRVQLKVIIPPEKLLVLDERGDHIPHYILGPYNEGSTINITCVSIGGRPLPNVTWWHESTLLDDTSQVLSEKRVKNVLQLKKLERRHLHMVFTCQASNNNVTNPISSSVTLDMNLRPLWVKLQGENRPLSADNPYNLVCEVCGSRPTPSITWWKGSMPMRNTREEISQDGNNTKSILSFTPTIDDRGKFLSCRAEQSLIPDSGIEDGWKLDIYHTPVVTLEFGTNLNSTSIREGADVYFECNIKSNPWVYRVSWRHNGKALDNSVPEGIIVANQSLVLQNVSRARSGLYTCVGSNREGDGESTINVNIKFPPVCRPGQKTTYSTGRQETVKVVCEVEANPYDITFHWKFNRSHNAMEFIDIPSSQVAVDRLKATAHYTPLTEHDYGGTLLCWGSNEIGTQAEPCVYNIIPAGRPDSLTNCTILNQTYNGFQIECVEGFDGGLPQDFVIEVYTVGNRQNPIIIKSKVPYFELKNLNSGAGYNVFMIAQNRKGRSNSTVLQVYTLKNPEKQTDLSLASGPAIENMKPFLAILLGIVGGMMFIAIVIVFIVRMRGSSGRDRNNCETTYTTTTTTMSNGQRNLQTSQDMGLARNLCNDSVESIEKNPDIIPQGNKLDDKDEDEKGFEWINNSNHPRMFATAAVAEQNLANSTSTYNSFNINSQNCTSLKQQQQQQQQHQHHAFPTSQHQTFITNYSTMVPHSKYNHIHKDLTYAELSAASPTQRIPYSTATLGRPRTSEFKRHEPTIYAQIDLAHPHTMYATSPMYVTSSATGVTMSHPSQLLTTFPPPPLFANNPTNNLINSTAIPPACFAEMHKTLLQPVPEVPTSTCTGSHISDDKTPMSGTRF